MQALVEVVLLPVHDYSTLKYRTRDNTDHAHHALEKTPIEYHNEKGRTSKAEAIESSDASEWQCTCDV